MWNILFDNLLYLTFPSCVMLICFADDTLLITSVDLYDDHISFTNYCPSLINNWMSKSYLSINFNKTKALSFIAILILVLTLLLSFSIATQSQIKYPAIIIDDELSFLLHIQHISEKAKTIHNVMR